jgi:hypothetical protein
MVRRLALALVVLASVACSTEDATSGEARSSSTRGTSTTEDPSVDEMVRLARPLPSFRRQCEEAAPALGLAIPCPRRLPLIGGRRIDCDGNCVAAAGGGQTFDMIFFLNVEGYDNEESPETVRHVIVEARRIERAPPSPCYEGGPAGSLRTNGRDVTVLECPPATSRAQGATRHGEGAHAGHVLGYWDEGGVRYVVSVHGATKPNRELLRRVVSSIEIIGP